MKPASLFPPRYKQFSAGPMTTRRRLLSGALGFLTVGAMRAARATALVATPRQTPGPFYPERLPLDSDNDLVIVASRGASAAGEITHVFGRVLAEDGRPVAGARIEIWQCDAFGYYHHPRDRGGRADPNFQGYGRMVTDNDGGYRFRTIKPVPYPGRTPHIHVAVSGPGIEHFTTQMYIAGHPFNDRDAIFNSVRDAAARARLAVPFAPAPDLEPGALGARFDVVLDRRLFAG